MIKKPDNKSLGLVIYYYLEIIPEKDKIEMTGSLGKRFRYLGIKILQLNKLGRIIYLK